MSDDGLTLAAVSRGVGSLPPAAVCHVGHCVADVLVELHERGGGCAPTAENVIVDDKGAVLFIPAGARSVPILDLHALGVVLSELALGHPFGGSAGIRTLGTGLPDRLVDALEVLVAPEDKRLRHASAAVRMFTEIEKLYGDGTAALADAVARARRNALRDTAPSAPQVEPRTMEMSRDAVLSMEDLRRIGAPPSPSSSSSSSSSPLAPFVPLAPLSSPAPFDTAIVDVNAPPVRAPPNATAPSNASAPQNVSAPHDAHAARSVNLNAARPERPEPSTKPLTPAPDFHASSSGTHANTDGPSRAAFIAGAVVVALVLIVLAFFAGMRFGARHGA